MFKESIFRGVEVYFLPRSAVDFLLDLHDSAIREVIKVSLLGDVLSGEFVRVLDSALLPRAV